MACVTVIEQELDERVEVTTAALTVAPYDYPTDFESFIIERTA